MDGFSGWLQWMASMDRFHWVNYLTIIVEGFCLGLSVKWALKLYGVDATIVVFVVYCTVNEARRRGEALW